MRDMSDVGRHMVRAAMAAPYLERDEEQRLARRWRDGREDAALHVLISSHMRLVMAMASKFRHYGLPMADLLQEGHVGLLEAAARFDPDREVRFSTYASWWIKASIQDHVLRNWSIVRGGTSSSQKALFFNLRRLRAKLTRGGDERISSHVYGRIAESIGVSVADVAMMDARLSGPDVSLNAPVQEDETSAERMDFIPDDAPLQDEVIGGQIDADRRVGWLRSALSVLSEREMKILHERRLTEQAETLESLGTRLGISKERVRQIENRALEKLKAALMQRHPEAAMAF